MINYLHSLLTKRMSDMEERGASAVEYGLLVAGIAVVIIVAVFVLGNKIKTLFSNTGTSLDNCQTNAPTTVNGTC